MDFNITIRQTNPYDIREYFCIKLKIKIILYEMVSRSWPEDLAGVEPDVLKVGLHYNQVRLGSCK